MTVYLISIPAPDTGPISFPASCGGAIPLTYLYPEATLSTLFYYQNATKHYYKCTWYITSPPGEQIQLSWLDVDIADNSRLAVHDQSTPPSYYDYGFQYMDLQRPSSPDGDFDINISSHLSTGSGLTLIYDDHSYDLATSGFHIFVSLKGKLAFICFGVACHLSFFMCHIENHCMQRLFLTCRDISSFAIFRVRDRPTDGDIPKDCDTDLAFIKGSTSWGSRKKMMALFKIVKFMSVMQRLIDKFKIFF